MYMYKKALALQPWLTEVYRALHQIPELGRELPETIAFVTSKLDEIGVRHRPCAGGILAELSAGEGRPTVALRADMDALPVEEETGLPWSSRHSGKMHACGHDVHTTCALGALRLLSMEEKRAATLRVLFQPDEEGDGGAAMMIEDGALDGVSAALGLHIAPTRPAGSIAAISGRARAASNAFSITLKGRGCHGAYPHLGIDTIAGAAAIISTLQTLVSRETDPLDSVALTIGHFEAGHARNVIPETAQIDGILRTLTPQTRKRCCTRLREIVTGMAGALRLQADIFIANGYPPVMNHPAEAEFVRQVAADEFGAENVIVPEFPEMGVDDFAYLAERVPGCYAELGCRGPDQPSLPLHNPHLAPHESCLPVGAAMTAAWALRHGEKG